jgi:hypothetical protein
LAVNQQKEIRMKKAVLVVSVIAVASGVRAGVVAGWDVSGVDVKDGVGLETNMAPYAFMATTGETGQVFAQLTLGDGVNPSTSANQYGFKIAGGDETNSLAGAIAGNHYIEFSLMITNGYQLNLDSIEMNGQATASGCSNVVLMSSIDGFIGGQEIAAASPVNVTGGFDTDASGFGAPIDLSDARYQNLTGTVSFRLYGWNSTSGSGSTYLRNLSRDDLVVHGTISELSSGIVPWLSMAESNGTLSVSAVFDGAGSTGFILQHRVDLTDSNGWNTVSAPFITNTTWDIEATNSAGFYRAIAQ